MDSRKAVTLLDASTGDVVRTFPAMSSNVACFAISRDEGLAAAGHDRTVKVGMSPMAERSFRWDRCREISSSTLTSAPTARGSQRPEFGTIQPRANYGGTGPDSKIPTGKLIRAIPDAGHSVAFSPDGKRLAICSESSGGLTGVLLRLQGSRVGITAGSAKLVDTETGKEVWSITMEGQSEKHLTFSPDGSLIASSYGRSGDIHVRDSATGKLLKTLRGHKDAATALAFSSDRERLAGGGADSRSSSGTWTATAESCTAATSGRSRRSVSAPTAGTGSQPGLTGPCDSGTPLEGKARGSCRAARRGQSAACRARTGRESPLSGVRDSAFRSRWLTRSRPGYPPVAVLAIF